MTEIAASTGSGSRTAVTSATAIDHAARAERPLRVTIIAANTFEFDSRFLRSALSLAEDGHKVTILALAGTGLPETEQLGEHVELIRLRLDRRLSSALRPVPGWMRDRICRILGADPAAEVLAPNPGRGIDRLRHPLLRLLEIAANLRRVGPWADAVVDAAPRTEILHCQSLVVLPVALAAARRLDARLVYDVADYHVGTERLVRMPWIVRELVRRQERRWARKASGHLAVSDPVADLVSRRWDVARPAVVLNCPPAWRPTEPFVPRSDLLHRAIAADPDRPIVLYQGGLNVGRGLEALVAAVDEPAWPAAAVVVFLGYGRLESDLRAAAARRPNRIHVLPAVPPDQLLEWTSGADVAYIGQPATELNWRMNLPNKLFESLMAGVPVIVSEGNEQCRLVRAEQVGVCSRTTPADIARTVSALLARGSEEQRRSREHCRGVALTRYTWDANASGLVELYRRLAAS